MTYCVAVKLDDSLVFMSDTRTNAGIDDIAKVRQSADIVKVVTNGQFGTQVLANDMFQQAFNIFNIGRGAALAMLIFISVLPVMYINIRRMQREN